MISNVKRKTEISCVTHTAEPIYSHGVRSGFGPASENPQIFVAVGPKPERTGYDFKTFFSDGCCLVFLFYPLGQQVACDHTSICSIRLFRHRSRLSSDQNPPVNKQTKWRITRKFAQSPISKETAGKPSRIRQNLF